MVWCVQTYEYTVMSYVSFYHLDGQKIAKKLSRGISKETNRTRQLLDEYNATLQAQGCFAPVSVSDVLSLSSKFWQDGDVLQKAMRKFHFLSRKISLMHTCELSAPVRRSNLLSKKCKTCSSI